MLGLLAALVAGTVIGALAAGLWARRRARQQRRQLDETRRRLEDARAARRAFLDLTTHELRTPLSAILGYQELLHDGAYGELGEDGRDAVRRLGQAARHLLHLIDGVMELSEMRTGDVPLEVQPLETGLVLGPAADAFRSQAEDRGLGAEVRMPEPLPTLRTDRERLGRALDLVITSAVRHPADQALTLTVQARAEELTVSLEPLRLDLGPGDDPALRLGIRLAVARGIAELLGGGLDLAIEDGHARRIALRIRDLGAPAPL